MIYCNCYLEFGKKLKSFFFVCFVLENKYMSEENDWGHGERYGNLNRKT